MRELHLGDNQIQDVSDIGKALRTNTSLTTLSLEGNQLAKVDELCEGLRVNRTLEALRLYGNRISEEDQNRIRQAKSDVLGILLFEV